MGFACAVCPLRGTLCLSSPSLAYALLASHPHASSQEQAGVDSGCGPDEDQTMGLHTRSTCHRLGMGTRIAGRGLPPDRLAPNTRTRPRLYAAPAHWPWLGCRTPCPLSQLTGAARRVPAAPRDTVAELLCQTAPQKAARQFVNSSLLTSSHMLATRNTTIGFGCTSFSSPYCGSSCQHAAPGEGASCADAPAARQGTHAWLFAF